MAVPLVRLPCRACLSEGLAVITFTDAKVPAIVRRALQSLNNSTAFGDRIIVEPVRGGYGVWFRADVFSEWGPGMYPLSLDQAVETITHYAQER